MSKINLLKPKVKRLAEQLLTECKRAKIDIVITQTLRTVAEQDMLYAQGRTAPGKIVTNARGGYSIHNYGLAFDFCPVKHGRAIWSNLVLFDKVGLIGEKIGLEWGGRWARFPDRPHFQYTNGYAVADFLNNRIDWQKFEI